MPIRDRSNRRLVRLGIIRLGLQVPNKSGQGSHPVQTDYFVLKDAPELAAYFEEQGIDKPRELDVLLPFRDIDRVFSAWYQVWAGGVLVCQGDGELVQYATPWTAKVDGKGATHVYNAPGDTLVNNGVAQVSFDWNGEHFAPGDHVPCPGSAQDAYPHCKACGIKCLLKVMMASPELFRMGYYQISTGSKRNHDTILGTLEAIPAERLTGIEFKLRLVEEATTYRDNDGKRKKGTKWFLQLEPDPTITRQLYQRAVSRMIDAPPPTAHIPDRTGPIAWEQEPPVDADEFNDEAEDAMYTEQPPEEPVPTPTPRLAIPNDLVALNVSDTKFLNAAHDLLGFKHIGAVKTALYSIFGQTWTGKTTTAAWEQLQLYQQAEEVPA